ncbi:MAG: T9SS type A sorting domain-containing protein [Bacteroidia bacterium]
MRFFTHLALLLGLFLLSLLQLKGQGYKSYLVYEGDREPLKLTANEIIPITDDDDLVITGAIKESGPNATAMAYIMRINADGYQTINSAFFTTQLSTQHEISSQTICQDGQGNFVLGGSSNQNPGSAGGERILSYVTDKGKLLRTQAQSEHSFESVIWDESQNYLVALSNNEGNTNPNTDIMLSQYDLNGNLINHATLSTPTKDNAAKLIAMPTGYVLAATSDLNNVPQVLVAYFDSDLNLLWANQYSNTDFSHRVEDVVHDGNGSLMIAGSATSVVDGTETAFLMGIEDNGSEQFYYTYFLDGGEQLSFSGLTHYTTNIDGRANGFLLSGSYHDPLLPAERRSFVLNLRGDGSVIWGKTYSVFPRLTDFDFDEELSDILYLPASQQFVAVGSFARSVSGTIDFRAALAVKSNVVNGQIDVQVGDCASELSFYTNSHSFQAFPVGTLYQNASNSSLNFAERELEWELRYCSYSLSPKPDNAVNGNPKIDFEVQANNQSVANYQLLGPSDWQSGTLELFDIRGAQLASQQIEAQQTVGEWDLPSLSPGVYLVRLKIEGKYYASRKLLIQ